VEQLDLSASQSTKLDQYSREELIQQHVIMRDEIDRLVRELYELRQMKLSDEQLQLITAEHLAALTLSIYGASSERYKKPKDKP
jgi:hypothetical protein